MDIKVNGKRITPINNKMDLYKQIHGLREGDILIVTHDCEVEWKTSMYANDRGIKIVRVD